MINRKILLYTLIILMLPVLLILLWFLGQTLRDPLDFIDYPMGELSVVQDSLFLDQLIPEPRVYHQFVFTANEDDTIRCILSLPDPMYGEPVPVLIILGGLEIGVETLKYIPDPGKNAIIIYQYPYHPRYWYYGSAITEIPAIRKSVLSVPSQVLSVYQWLSDQSWADSSRVSIAGYSFGALFMPSTLHLAQHYNMPVKQAVISYGAADLYRLLVANMTNIDQPWRSLISRLAITAIRGIEPACHAPHIRSDILLINGTADKQIPESCWRELHRLIPEPKHIIILEEGHMDPRKTELTMKLVQITKEWLAGKGAING